MTDAPLTPREMDEALAAEYVLGVQDLAERHSVETRLRRDPVFAALVTDWENRLAGLNHGFDDVPAPDLWPRIEARLFPKPARPARFDLLRWLAGATVAASLVFTAVLVLPSRPDLVAVLASKDNSLSYLVTSLDDRLQVKRVVGAAAGDGQVHELWVIAPGAAPVSLGLLSDQPLKVTYPKPPAGWILAVSVEPQGGSPTGQPTGPVILVAEIGA